MGERYWVKPTGQIRLFGDKVLAQTHIKRARVYAGLLMSQTSKVRPTRFHQWEEPDGTTIWVQVWNDLLGQRAIVEITTPSVEDVETGIYYMDSGFVLPMETYGRIWQTGETSDLYLNYAGIPLTPFLPKEGVSNGDQPPSFLGTDGVAYAAKKTAVHLQDPGNYTGKLRWLIAGQYGLDLKDRAWVERDNFTRTTPYVPRLSGEGIFTDSDRDYWSLRIEASGTTLTGSATLLETPLRANRPPLSGVLSVEQRQYETHALALAKKTATVWPIDVVGDALPAGVQTTPLPFGYGWHFNEQGTEASIVTHDLLVTAVVTIGLPSISYAITTRVYTAAITKNELAETFTFDVRLVSTHEWYVPLYVSFWRPRYIYPDRANHVALYATNPGSQEQFDDAPIHCCYDSNDELKLYTFSYTKTTLPGVTPRCGHGYPTDNATRSVSDDYPEGDREIFSVDDGIELFSVVNGPIRHGYWGVTHTVSMEGRSSSYTGIANGIAEYSINQRAGLCPNGAWEEIFHFGGCFGGGPFYKTTVNNETWITQEQLDLPFHTNKGVSGALTVIIPLGDADTILCFSQELDGYSGGLYRHQVPPYPETLWKRQTDYLITPIPYPIPTPCSGYSEPTLLVAPVGNFGTWQIVENYSTFIIGNRCAVMAPSEQHTHTYDTTPVVNRLGEGPMKDLFSWHTLTAPSPSNINPIVISRGLTGAIRWTDGFGAHLENDYPELATLQIGWS